VANSYVDQKELGVEDEMPIGKYKGQIMVEVLIADKDYLLWFVDNIDDYDLCDELQSALECDSDYHELLEEYS